MLPLLERVILPRRDFIVFMATLASGALLLGGCGEKKGQDFLETALYYPELSDWKVKDNGSFFTVRGKTQWWNFGDLKVNPDAFKAMVDFCEEVAKGGNVLSYTTPAGVIQMKVNPRIANDHIFTILPEAAPAPQWAGQFKNGATRPPLDQGLPTLSFVRELSPTPQRSSYFPEKAFITATALAVECAQATMEVQTEDPKNISLVQELAANSFGRAIAMAQHNVDWADYNTWIRSNPLVLSSQNGAAYSAIPFNEATYNQIPRTGMALTE